MPHGIYWGLLAICWGGLGLFWVIGWIYNLWKAPVVQRRSTFLPAWILSIALVWGASLFLRHNVLAFMTFTASWLQIIGATLLISATAFTLWARIVLGTMWAAVAEIKRVINSDWGPLSHHAPSDLHWAHRDVARFSAHRRLWRLGAVLHQWTDRPARQGEVGGASAERNLWRTVRRLPAPCPTTHPRETSSHQPGGNSKKRTSTKIGKRVRIEEEPMEQDEELLRDARLIEQQVGFIRRTLLRAFDPDKRRISLTSPQMQALAVLTKRLSQKA